MLMKPVVEAHLGKKSTLRLPLRLCSVSAQGGDLPSKCKKQIHNRI